MVPRFFCPGPLPAGGEFALPAEVAHHADKVLRLRAGDALVLFDGNGGEWSARLLSLGCQARAELLERSCPQRESPLELVLVQALASGDKMDWVVQKAVELGAARLVPLACERSVLRLSGERADKRLKHWQQIAVAACEQCGRNRVPVVETLQDLPGYLQWSAGGVRRLVLAPQGGTALASLTPPAGPMHLLVGPEGGWSERELELLARSRCEVLALGPRVLRTETAGLAALAALQALWGDF